jgi:hypothetical protein
MTRRFTDECLWAVRSELRQALSRSTGVPVWFETLDPDTSDERYAGEYLTRDGVVYCY